MNNNAPKMERCGTQKSFNFVVCLLLFMYDLNNSSSVSLIPYIHNLSSIISLSIISKALLKSSNNAIILLFFSTAFRSLMTQFTVVSHERFLRNPDWYLDNMSRFSIYFPTTIQIVSEGTRSKDKRAEYYQPNYGYEFRGEIFPFLIPLIMNYNFPRIFSRRESSTHSTTIKGGKRLLFHTISFTSNFEER